MHLNARNVAFLQPYSPLLRCMSQNLALRVSGGPQPRSGRLIRTTDEVRTLLIGSP